jgi:hypothetical protein
VAYEKGDTYLNSHLEDAATAIGFRGEEIKNKTNSALNFNLSTF